MKNFSKIKQRILQYIEYKGINKRNFYIQTGISNGTLDKSSGLSEYGIEKFISTYPDVNPEWLLTGEGEMLKNKEMIPAGEVEHNTGIKPIPLVEQSVVAGFGSSDFTITERDVKEYYVVPKFRYHKVDFMIEVYGNSMYPKYNSGDIVACTIINDSQFIQWNKPHVVGTKYQGILVKRILPGKDDSSVILKSDNKDYPPFEVPKSEITGMALVVGVIRSE